MQLDGSERSQFSLVKAIKNPSRHAGSEAEIRWEANPQAVSAEFSAAGGLMVSRKGAQAGLALDCQCLADFRAPVAGGRRRQ
jgi:hypothetical protein